MIFIETYSFKFSPSIRWAFLVVVILFLNQSVHAQNKSIDTLKSLNEIVVTGVPFPIRAKNALNPYQVITKSQIQAQGAANLADLLNQQLHINLTNDGVTGSTNLQMQGLNGSNVKILLDGIPITGRENGNIDLGQINLVNIEKIEIIQGAMNVIYGSDALGGVINLISTKNMKNSFLNTQFLYESLGTYDLNTQFGFSKKNTQMRLSLGRFFFDGWQYLDSTSPHREMYFKPKEQYLGDLDFKLKLAKNVAVNFASHILNEKVVNKGNANINSIKAYAIDEYYYSNRWINQLNLTIDLNKYTKLNFLNALSLYYHQKKTIIKDLVSLNESLSQGTGDQDTTQFKDYNFKSNLSNQKHFFKYDCGYDFIIQEARSTKIEEKEKHIGDFAGYGETSFSTFENKLTIQIGGRWAYNSLFTVPVVYSANGLFKPDSNWQLRASVSKGFRAPTLKEMYLHFFDSNHQIEGNENLKAETGMNYQVSATNQCIRNEQTSVQIVLNINYNNIKNEILLVKSTTNPNSIAYTYNNLIHFQNLINTLQIEFTKPIFNANFGISLINNFKNESYATNNYNFEYNARVGCFIKKLKINGNIFYKYTGKRNKIDVDGNGFAADGGLILPAYHLIDASLQKTFLNKKLQLIIGVKNILNTTTLTTTGINNSFIPSGHGDNNSTLILGRRFFSTIQIKI